MSRRWSSKVVALTPILPGLTADAERQALKRLDTQGRQPVDAQDSGLNLRLSLKRGD